MAKKIFLISFFILLGFFGSAQFSEAAPLTVHPANPRYFTDDSGKAVYLTGSHTWTNFQSWGESLPKLRRLDFNAYLNWLEEHNHNVIRLWVADTAWRFENNTDYGACEPQPFVRTGSGNALYGGLKFNLNQLNQTYFDELRNRVQAAQERGMYVIIMLFDVWGTGAYGSTTIFRGSPFHFENNINGINGDPNGDSKGMETHTLAVPAVTAIQENYVRMVIDTLNDFDNILYEIINEGSTETQAFQEHFSQFIKNYESSKPKRHLVGANAMWPIFTYPSGVDFISPMDLGATAPYAVNPPIPTTSQVVITDTDHIDYPRDTQDPWIPFTWVWKSFLRGLNPIYMDTIHKLTGDIEFPGASNAQRAMGDTLRYANKMDLIHMLPSDNSADCSTTYCLRNPGNEYLVYQPATGSFNVNLQAGDYQYEWFNPASGAMAGTGIVTVSSGNKFFTPPFSGDAVLYLKATAPTCFNQTCDSWETCSSCPQDCGQCPPVISKNNWTLKYVDSQETSAADNKAQNAFDGNSNTLWHTRYSGATDPQPHEIQINLGAVYSVQGFRYLPRQDGVNGTIKNYEFSTSLDGNTWTIANSGAFSQDTSEKTVNFSVQPARYIKFKSTSEINGGPWTSIAEISVLGTTGSDTVSPAAPSGLSVL